MKVVRVVTRPVGGPARQALILDRELSARGHSSGLVWGIDTLGEGSEDSTQQPVTTVPTLRRELHLINDTRAARSLVKIMRLNNPQVVHTHMAKAGALGRWAAMRTGVPIIVHTFHGHIFEGYFSRPARRLFLQAERWLAPRTTALIAVSESVKSDLLTLGIGRPDQWRVIPLGLDIEDLLASRLLNHEARASLGLPAHDPVVAIIGRLAPIKDLPTFFESAALLRERHKRVRFVVVGDGPQRDKVVSHGKALLGERFYWLGYITDLKPVYAAADVVVQTSLNEGTPAALIEASAAGRPIVATNVGGVSEVVKHRETGFLVEARRPDQIAEKVSALLENSEHARSMGEAGRRWVAKRYSSERLVDDITALYGELLEQASSRT